MKVFKTTNPIGTAKRDKNLGRATLRLLTRDDEIRDIKSAKITEILHKTVLLILLEIVQR